MIGRYNERLILRVDKDQFGKLRALRKYMTELGFASSSCTWSDVMRFSINTAHKHLLLPVIVVAENGSGSESEDR